LLVGAQSAAADAPTAEHRADAGAGVSLAEPMIF